MNKHGDEVTIVSTVTDEWQRKRYDGPSGTWRAVASGHIAFEAWGTFPPTTGALLPQGGMHAIGPRVQDAR